MRVLAFESADWAQAIKQGLTEEKAVTAITSGLEAIKELLPTLPNTLNITVRPYFEGIIPEYGTGARTHDSEFIEIWFDKAVPHGLDKTLASLHQTVFHEGNHAARWNTIPIDFRLIESAIFEGLATVFERDYAKYQPLYGIYEDDETMRSWLEEIISAKDDWNKRDALFFDHPDGRRWIGYKTGTWLVDIAVKKSGRPVIELTTLPADEILELAEI